jgi:hypothetical protein
VANSEKPLGGLTCIKADLAQASHGESKRQA